MRRLAICLHTHSWACFPLSVVTFWQWFSGFVVLVLNVFFFFFGVCVWEREWVCGWLCAWLKGCSRPICVWLKVNFFFKVPHYVSMNFMWFDHTPLSLAVPILCLSPETSLVGEILWPLRLSSQLSSTASSLLFTSIYEELPHAVSSLCWRSWYRHNNVTRCWWVNFIPPKSNVFFFVLFFLTPLGNCNKTNQCHSYFIYYSPFLFIDWSYLTVVNRDGALVGINLA